MPTAVIYPASEYCQIISTQTIAYTGVSSSTQITVATVIPRRFLLLATTDCHIIQSNGANTATATDFLLLANTYLVITTIGTTFLGIIRDTTNGTLYVTRTTPL